MPTLRLDEVAEEAVCIRVQCCRERCGTCLHRPAAFVRAVRHGQAAFALKCASGNLGRHGFIHLGAG